MQSNQKQNLLLLLIFCLCALGLLWAIWYYYEKRLEEIDQDIQRIQLGVLYMLAFL